MKMRTCQRCGLNRNVGRYVGIRGRICDKCRRTKRSASTKGVRLEQTYGITLVEWHAMLRAQGDSCAICQGKRATYDVDHDHKLEKALIAQGISPLTAARMSVRGLLCKRCNRRLLPASTDSLVVLARAMDYLSSPPAHKILMGGTE